MFRTFGSEQQLVIDSHSHVFGSFFSCVPREMTDSSTLPGVSLFLSHFVTKKCNIHDMSADQLY